MSIKGHFLCSLFVPRLFIHWKISPHRWSLWLCKLKDDLICEHMTYFRGFAMVVSLSHQCELHCPRCFLCAIGKRACSSQMSRENYTSPSLMNGSTVSGGGLRGSSLMSWELKHCQSLPRPCLLRSGQSEEQFNSGPLKQRGMASRWFLSRGSKGRNNALLSHASWGITAPNLIRGDLINWKMGISLKLSHA